MSSTHKAPGTHRVLLAEQVTELVQPLLGAAGVTRVADITGLDVLGVPVVTAVRPNSRSLSVSQGKGCTLADARASAIMEALETYAAETIRPALRLATIASLRATGDDAVEVDLLPRLPGADAPSGRVLLWCTARHVATGAPLAVPFDVVHTDWTLPSGYGHGCFPADSNGLASGGCWPEAVLHGLTELIERDAAALWDHRQEPARATTRLDESTVDDQIAVRLIERLHAAQAAVALWDLTCDTRVPVVLCQLVDADPDPFRPLPAAAGLGCHPDPATALRRAITEAAQSRLVQIAGARDDQLPGEYHRCLDPAGTQLVRELIGATAPGRPWRASAAVAAGWDNEDIADDLTEAQDRVRAVTGHGAVAVDLTPPGWPVAVARVLAPGLEGLGAMFGGAAAPGRRAMAVAGEWEQAG